MLQLQTQVAQQRAHVPGSCPDVQAVVELWQELPAPLSHLHPPQDRLCHRADHRHHCQVLSSLGPTHNLLMAHGTAWPQGPHHHLSSSPPKPASDDPPEMRRA